eukprot:Gb_32966 [translate_table: standard]
MIAQAWEYHDSFASHSGDDRSSTSSSSVENDHGKPRDGFVRNEEDNSSTHEEAKVTELVCRSDSNNCSEDNVKSETHRLHETDEFVAPPNNLHDSLACYEDTPWSPDQALVNSSRPQSEISADTHDQERGKPSSKWKEATNDMCSNALNSRDRISQRATPSFEGSCSKLKDEYFPKWRLPMKIQRKISTPNNDSIQDEPKSCDADDVGLRYAQRVCVDCNTNKTPLWRSGPQGPKSLCNACGIRYRKKRRAMLASLNSGITDETFPSKKRNKALIPSEKQQQQHSRSCDPVSFQVEFLAFCQRHGFGQDVYGHLKKKNSKVPLLDKHSTIQRRFAEEEEAAVLLMALSYGLVHV